MANSHQGPRFDGDYDKFLETWRMLEIALSGHNVKNRKFLAVGDINCRAIFLWALMSTCPAKTIDWQNDWNMSEICDQNDIDRPGPDNGYYREQLEEFETEVLDGQDKKDVVQFLSTVFSQVIAQFFSPSLPEMLNIDRTDPFFVIRFLQSVYTNYLNHVKQNNSNIVTDILDKSRSWKGGGAQEYKQHLSDIQAMMAKLPPSLRGTCDQNLIINMVISNLKDDSKLDALHTIIRSKYNDSPASVTFAYIEREVTSILKDKSRPGGISADILREDPVASMATFYAQKRSFQPRGKFQGNQSRSPISKPKAAEGRYRIPATAWKAMSEAERQEAVKVMRSFNEVRDSSTSSSSRGRGGRGRGGKTAQSQRRPESKSEAEADIAEITSANVSCFNTEITQEMSDMSTISDESSGAQPTVLFAAADDSQQKVSDSAETTEQSSPKVESSPIDPGYHDSGIPAFTWLPIAMICTIFWGLLMGAGKFISECVKRCLQLLRSMGFMLVSFLSNPMQAAQSATSCSTAQYKPYFRFFGGSFIQFGIMTAVLILVIAIILQCGAQAASVGHSSHINASRSLLTYDRISPFLSEQAAESLLQFKNGAWLLSYQRNDLEAHVAATPSADHDVSLDWCLDSGASCHFCNDSSKFVSMKKCNVSISTAKKGETIQAIGIGNCQITTQNANGELVNLILHDTLYVPDARRNLLSVSKLAQDRFQVVLPADNSLFRPGIYNCRPTKTSVEHSIPIIPVGSLFHVQTCADAEIKRHDRVENKWICWHRRLGYMPLDTIQQMINTCQGLDDLQGIAMPRNYVSANVRRGKAINQDQPKSNSTRADSPMQIIHFDLFGPCKNPSFAGHCYCCVFVDDHSRYTWVYTVKTKSEVIDVFKRFYADTAIIRSKHPLCCIRRDNAGENMSNALKTWLTDNGIRSETSTPFEPWQNGRAEVQIRILCNIARTNMIASGLTGKFWARAIFYAADISNIQYRSDLKMSPHQSLLGTKPDVSKCQPFGVECWLYVRAEQRQDRKFDARGEPAIYCGRSTMDNRSSHVLYMPGRARPTFVSSNNVVFGNRCPMAKDAPNVIENGEVAVDFPPEANVADISSSSVASILNQNDTHYILQMTDTSVKSMAKPLFVSSFVRAQNATWSQKNAELMNQILFLEEVNSFASDSFFNAQSVHFTSTAKYVDPTSYADAMSRPDAKLWQEAFDKEMNGLVKRNVFTVVDRPADRNPLGTTMVYKYKIDHVKNSVTRKCRLCLRGDWQKEGIDFFKYKTFSAVLNSRENRALYALAAGNNWHMFSSDITQAFTYGKLDVPLFCHPPPGFECPPGTVLGLNYCLYGAKQAPACFKGVATEFMLSEGFTAVNDSQTVWIKSQGRSILINAWFVDDVHHCTNDLSMYRSFRKRFEKRFDLKSDDHIDVYLGNRLLHDRAKGTVTVNQEHYLLACLEKFGLANCNGVDKPITSRLTIQDQPETVNLTDQELYRGMVGSLLYLASWTRPDIAFAVSELSRFVSNPGKPHLEAAKRVFRYLRKTLHLGLVFRSSSSLSNHPEISPNTLWGYVDSDWAGCPDSRRSTSGFVFMLNGAAISWRSKRQPTVALSSAEAEFISASAMVQEVIFLRKFLHNLGFPQTAPTPVFADNETCIAWSEGSVGGSERAKHVDLRMHFVHEARAAGHLHLHKIESRLNAADILTKASTSPDIFADLRRRIMGY